MFIILTRTKFILARNSMIILVIKQTLQTLKKLRFSDYQNSSLNNKNRY